jgi:hypothetical protein
MNINMNYQSKFIESNRQINVLGFNRPVVFNRNIRSLPKKNEVPINKIEELPKERQMLWGQPTWLLFHTLAHKIKEEYFNQIKFQLFEMIKNICYNLPCPTCAIHARSYIDKINVNSIQTKEDLKKILFDFHNVANSKKKNELFKYEDLDSKYSVAITINIIKNFFVFFQDKHYNVKLITENINRNRIIFLAKNWFNKNIQFFDP